MHASTHLTMDRRPNPSKDAGAVADSLTGIHSAMVKCLFVVKRSFIHKGFQVSPQVKLQRIQIWRAWRPCSGSSSTYPSAMILGTSRTARLQCAGAPSCALSAMTHKLNVSGHVLMWIFFLVSVCGSPAQSSPAYTIYR
jgi:hypothetical protein